MWNANTLRRTLARSRNSQQIYKKYQSRGSPNLMSQSRSIPGSDARWGVRDRLEGVNKRGRRREAGGRGRRPCDARGALGLCPAGELGTEGDVDDRSGVRTEAWEAGGSGTGRLASTSACKALHICHLLTAWSVHRPCLREQHVRRPARSSRCSGDQSQLQSWRGEATGWW